MYIENIYDAKYVCLCIVETAHMRCICGIRYMLVKDLCSTIIIIYCKARSFSNSF